MIDQAITDDLEHGLQTQRSMPPRRVLILAYRFPPVATAGVHRTMRFAKFLPRYGWEPIIVTASHKDSREPVDANLLHRLPSSIPISRTPVWRVEQSLASVFRSVWPQKRRSVPAGPPPQPMKPRQQNGRKVLTLREAIQDVVFATPDEAIWWMVPAVRAGIRLAQHYKPDVIYTTGPVHSTHVIGVALRLCTRLPLVLDFRDPWSRCPWGPRKSYTLGRYLHGRLENVCVRQAACVILNNHRLEDEFRRHYVDLSRNHFCAITNGFDPEIMPDVAPAENMPAGDQSPADRLHIMHPGSLYSRRDPRPFLRAVARLAENGFPIHFEQFGNCDPRFDLPQYIRQLKLGANVRLHPTIPQDQLHNEMRRANAFLLLQPVTDTQIPGKLFEMIAFGKPILALTSTGATSDIVNNHGLGIVVRHDDSDAIANAIRKLVELSRRQDATSLQQRARQIFDGRRLTAQLATVLDTAASKRRQ